MTSSVFRQAVLAAAVCGALSACGGGVSGSGPGPVAGVGGTGGGPRVTTVGTVTGFGSVFVNGVEYFTSDDDVQFFQSSGQQTLLELDGEDRVGQNGLRVGMVVRLSGELDDGQDGSGVALTIIYDDDVEGPVTNVVDVSATVKEFDVLGVPVRVQDGVTVFDDDTGAIGFADIVEGALIEVSGFRDANDVVVATRVERKSATPVNLTDLTGVQVELKGTVANLVRNGNDDGGSFDLTSGSVTRSVVFLDSELDDDTTPQALAGTDPAPFVEVKGTLNTDGSVVDAIEVELEEEGGLPDTPIGESVSLEGLVGGFQGDATSGSFSINGQAVSYDSGTVFLPSTLAGELADGLKVEVEGTIVNGTLVAARIEPRSGLLRVEAAVTGVDTTSRTLTLAFAGNMVQVVTTNSTLMRDEATRQAINLSDLAPGEFVEIEAYDNGEGEIVATRLERAEEADDPRLQGRFVSFDASGADPVLVLRLADLQAVFTLQASTLYTRLDDTPYSGGATDFDNARSVDYDVDSLIKVTLDEPTATVVVEVEVESGL